MVTMLNKSIKLSEKDRICLGDIIKRDHRMLKGPSEALRVIMEDAAEDVPDWREVQRRADELGYPKELMIGTDSGFWRDKTTITSHQAADSICYPHVYAQCAS